MLKQIKAPTHCPSCDSVLIFKNDILYCLNDACEAKSLKAIQHFCKTVKCKGLGPASIEKLDISSLEDLYELSLEDFELALGSKIGCKVFAELEKTKILPLNVTLPAFNVPLIGKSATEKLSLSIPSLDELNEQESIKAGLGPKATENLLNWIENIYKPRYRNVLPLNFTFEKINKPKQIKGIVCISGKLNSFKSKAKAQEVLEQAGYLVKSSLTKDVTILINESGKDSAKTSKAEQLGIDIITDIKTQLLGE